MAYLLIFLALFCLLFLLSRLVSAQVSQLLFQVTGSRNLAIRLFHFLLLPGVVIHELAHLVIAEIMLVRTGGLSFKPEEDGEKVIMGSVGIERTDPVRRAIIGFAPVFVGILLISFFVFYFLSGNSPMQYPWNYALVFFVVFEIGNTMFSSKRDLGGTIKLLFVIAIIIIIAYLLGFRIPNWIINFPNSPEFVSIAQKGIRILLFPIAIDLLIILLTRFLIQRH